MPGKQPVALILFSHDMDHFLPMVEKERKIIEEALEHFSDTNRLKVIARSSVSIEEVFRLFNRYRGQIALFHFAGHAGGKGLQFNKDFEDTDLGRAVGLAELFRREVAEGMLQLVFLNGCSTNPQLEGLKAAGVPSVISTYHPIEDDKAIAFAKQFYHTLANTDHEKPFANLPTLQEAFDHALAYLKTAGTVEEREPAAHRDFVFNVEAKVDGETWTLYSDNPGWKLSAEVAGEQKPFNEELTFQLMSALQPYSRPAQKFQEKAKDIPGWEAVARISDKAKDIIAYSYVGVLGVQLRKLFAIGKEPLSEDKQRRYLDNCLLTGKRALQLLCFTLLSSLWDHRKGDALELEEGYRARLQNFFEDEFELDILGYLELLKTLCALFSGHRLDYPLAELKDFRAQLEEESDFVKACERLQGINVSLDKSKFDLSDCFAAERHLTVLLRALSFLAAYRMVSVKNIAYDEMRNAPPRYLHHYTALGIDSKRNVNAERVQYAETPITTDAVLLFKGRYQQSINLFPFIIDLNALTLESGARLCFYSCQDIADGSLNYRFQEDNSLENITYKATLKEDADLGQLMMDPAERTNYKLDFVYLQFQEAKKTILPGATTEPEEEDFFGEEDDF